MVASIFTAASSSAMAASRLRVAEKAMARTLWAVISLSLSVEPEAMKAAQASSTSLIEPSPVKQGLVSSAWAWLASAAKRSAPARPALGGKGWEARKRMENLLGNAGILSCWRRFKGRLGAPSIELPSMITGKDHRAKLAIPGPLSDRLYSAARAEYKGRWPA